MVAEGEGLEQGLGPRAVGRDAHQTRLDHERLDRREERVVADLLGDQADQSARRAELAHHVVSEDLDGTARRPAQPGDAPDEGGLARAVGAKQREDLSCLHLEIDLVDGHEVFESLDDLLAEERGGGHGPRHSARTSARQ